MWRSTTAVGLFVSLAAGTACEVGYPVIIATEVRATIDVSRFQSVLVAGFVTAEFDSVDTNEEMVRLLRSQLKSKSRLRVIDADAPPIASGLITDAAYWKKVGEEHREPLIVTGTVVFERFDELQPMRAEARVSDPVTGSGRMHNVPMLHDRARFVLEPTFTFVDGSTGAVLYSRSFREEMLYRPDENVPPLSAFFDLMDRLLPDFLAIVGQQAFYGQRILLK